MANEDERNLLRKNGILINHLPQQYIEETLRYFPPACIRHRVYNSRGLYIYFHEESKALTYARSHAILVNGQSFRISLTVTSLTIHGISALLPVRDLQDLMESNGYEDIIFVYQVGGRAEYDTHVTFIMSDDCRVILDIAEMSYMERLTPILWPQENFNLSFNVSFFCRLCRQNGHKSCECTNFPQLESIAGNYDQRNVPVGLLSNVNELNIGQLYIQGASTNISDNTISLMGYQGTRSLMSEAHLNRMDEALESNGRSPESETSNSQATVCLSRGIILAINNVVDNPHSLITFLNHARRRKNKKVKEITLAHANNSSENISNLINQLKSIKDNYYSSVRIRGPSEDSDLKYIDNLVERLGRLFQCTVTGLADNNSGSD